jgi:hypothetical protein
MATISGPKSIDTGVLLYLDAANYKSYNPNLLLWGQTFNNGYWSNNSTTLLSTSEVAPDGTNTATRIEDNSTSSYQWISRSLTVPNTTQTYSLSVYVKKTSGGTAPGFAINTSFSGGTSISSNQRLNTDTGVATAASTTSEGDYWRMFWTATNNTSGNTLLNLAIYPAARAPGGVADTTTATGSATIWGVLVTRGSTLLTYSPNFGTSGNDWRNLGSSSFIGTLTNRPSFVSGSIDFDGQDDYISLDSPSRRFAWAPAGTTGNKILTIEIWVKTTDTTGQIFSKPWNGSGNYNYRLDAAGFHTQVVTPHVLNFSSIADGTWKHVVAIANETQKAVYVNSSLVAGFTNHGETSDSPSSGDESLPLSIMTLFPYGEGTGSWPQPTHAVNGSVGMFRIYNRQLAENEIIQNFESTRGRYGI